MANFEAQILAISSRNSLQFCCGGRSNIVLPVTHRICKMLELVARIGAPKLAIFGQPYTDTWILAMNICPKNHFSDKWIWTFFPNFLAPRPSLTHFNRLSRANWGQRSQISSQNRNSLKLVPTFFRDFEMAKISPKFLDFGLRFFGRTFSVFHFNRHGYRTWAKEAILPVCERIPRFSCQIWSEKNVVFFDPFQKSCVRHVKIWQNFFGHFTLKSPPWFQNFFLCFPGKPAN